MQQQTRIDLVYWCGFLEAMLPETQGKIFEPKTLKKYQLSKIHETIKAVLREDEDGN